MRFLPIFPHNFLRPQNHAANSSYYPLRRYWMEKKSTFCRQPLLRFESPHSPWLLLNMFRPDHLTPTTICFLHYFYLCSLVAKVKYALRFLLLLSPSFHTVPHRTQDNKQSIFIIDLLNSTTTIGIQLFFNYSTYCISLSAFHFLPTGRIPFLLFRRFMTKLGQPF